MRMKKVYVVMVENDGEELCYVRATHENGIPCIDLSPLRSKGFHFSNEEAAQVASDILEENGHKTWVELFYKAVI